MTSSVADHKQFKASLFNTGAETLNEKASFKKPFKSQRCIVPAGGFFE
jgi:putative SOS response-associated peptidase YedK